MTTSTSPAETAPARAAAPADDDGLAITDNMPPLTAKGLLLGTGPRFARDAFGPLLAFYVGWKVFGLVAGIAASMVLSIGAFISERRRERDGALALVGLGLALIQALVGLLSGSENLYLATPVVISALYGIAFLGSAAIRRPLTGTFARSMYPIPPEVRESATYKRVFGIESVVWGVYLLARSGIRLLVLGKANVEAFLLINTVTGVPLTMLLMSWSVWYGVRGFRRSDEWGPIIASFDAAASGSVPVPGPVAASASVSG